MSSLKVGFNFKAGSYSQGYYANTNVPKTYHIEVFSQDFDMNFSIFIIFIFMAIFYEFAAKRLNGLEPCSGMVPCYVNIKLHDLVGV